MVTLGSCSNDQAFPEKTLSIQASPRVLGISCTAAKEKLKETSSRILCY